jgi:uncharacterized membrane protein YkoI
MGQRQALLLATFLTTFGLVLIGAVAMRLTNNPNPSDGAVLTQTETTPLTTTESTTATVLTPDEQAVNDLVASRQASYEQALAQANAQLQAANEQLAQLQGGLVAPAPDSAAPNVAPAASPVPVSADAAGQIALAAAPNTTITAAPFLVDFQGTVAYEVATGAGLLYIDANTGTILFNGAAPAPAPQSPATAPQPSAPAPATSETTTAPSAPAAPAPTSVPSPSTISEAQALDIAVSAVGPGTIDQIKLEEEHGILIWDVKFTNDNEVRIDAYTGAIVRTRIENDND